MAPHEHHSDLEVVPQSESLDQQKFAYYSPEPEAVHPNFDDTNKISYEARDDEAPARRETICGLRRRTLWIVFLVAIIVIVAAVGGGVGGALSSKSSSNKSTTNNNTPQQPQSSSSSSSGALNVSTTPTPTSASPSTPISTTQLVGPSSTILRDCPSSNNTIYDTTFGSTTMQFRKACGISFQNANGIENVIGTPMASLDDCINACASYNINNRTSIAQGNERICNAVCWRNTFDTTVNDWPGGMCFGYTTQNVTAGGESAWRFRDPVETRCDSAALINQDY